MKKAIFLALSLGLMAGQAFAAGVVCDAANPGAVPGGTTSSAGGNVYKVTAGYYVVTSFPLKCSQNTVVSTDENSVAIAIGSLSLKGKSIFEGSSAGGAIKPARTCTGTCTSGNESSNLSTLLAQATL